jgi:hypothetical protein
MIIVDTSGEPKPVQPEIRGVGPRTREQALQASETAPA